MSTSYKQQTTRAADLSRKISHTFSLKNLEPQGGHNMIAHIQKVEQAVPQPFITLAQTIEDSS
jgi:glucose-6-phosphate isomerase